MRSVRLSSSRSRGSRWPWFVGLLAAAIAPVVLAAACGDEGDTTTVTEGDRVTISLAVLDDPSRRAALYAIEQGIITSETVDLSITYLPMSAIGEAAPTRQYDVIEASPLEVIETSPPTVPAGLAQDPDYVILSAGLVDLDGTLLFVTADADLADPGDLRGKTVAVPSLESASTLETRYLLQEEYGLDVSPEVGDVRIRDLGSAQELATRLGSGDVDAAVMVQSGAFQLLENDDFSVLSRVTDEVRGLTGAPVVNSVLATYPDVAEQKTDALVGVNRLLAESVAYFKANQGDVNEAVAAEQGEDEDYLRWWWERQDLPLGDLSPEVQEELLDLWEAAKAVGDIESYPELASVLFIPEAVTPEPEE